MDILLSLGIDHTVGYHFLLFVVVFLFLSQFVFKPYFSAYKERANRTIGGQENAQQLIAETEKLHLEYERKARAMNKEHKKIFDTRRSEALHAHDEVIQKAKVQAQEYLDTARGKINGELKAARQEVSTEVSSISDLIVNKVAGRELIQ